MTMDMEIYCICESHLKDKEEITVPGYTWICHNRLHLMHLTDPFNSFEVKILDNSMKGILWTQLQSRYDNEHTVLLCVAYLPPSDSCRGDTAQTFYDTLLGQVYIY